MSKTVTVVVSGMAPKTVQSDASNIRELLEELSIEGDFKVQLGRSPATLDSSFDDYATVVLGEKIKGNAKTKAAPKPVKKSKKKAKK